MANCHLMQQNALFFSKAPNISSNNLTTTTITKNFNKYLPGTDPGFQIRGAHLKKLCQAEGGAKIFGVFRVKNHDFTPKNQIFSNC